MQASVTWLHVRNQNRIKSKLIFKIKEHILLGLMWAWRTVDWWVVVGSCSQLLRNRLLKSVTVSVLSQSSWWVVAGSCQVQTTESKTFVTSRLLLSPIVYMKDANMSANTCQLLNFYSEGTPSWASLQSKSFTRWNMFAAIVLPKQSQEGLRGSIFF